MLDLLAFGGILSGNRFGVSGRTLRGYQASSLITRVLIPSSELFFQVDRRSDVSLAFYCLGTAGEEIARRRHAPMPPLTGYLVYTHARVLHDLYLTEVVLRMAEAARARGWRTWWAGTNAAEIRKGSEQIVEPDSMLVLERDGQRKAFAIEFHNEEEKRQRAFEKVRRYERLRDMPDLWMNAWELDEFPTILAVFRDAAVGNGYRAATHEMKTKNFYYGKLLDAFFTFAGDTFPNLQEWVNVNTGGKEVLF